MGADMDMLAEERDFFRRELVKMELVGGNSGTGNGIDGDLVDIDGGEWADVAGLDGWN